MFIKSIFVKHIFCTSYENFGLIPGTRSEPKTGDIWSGLTDTGYELLR